MGEWESTNGKNTVLLLHFLAIAVEQRISGPEPNAGVFGTKARAVQEP